ncbi:3-keto-disaccharide hydrolase [Thalassotalea atypica]|uniref:3-keto-disaccharide hydrolase n=1 Tax=Thalassotalea atypica TaxID=2054316 RepID=UPI002572A2D2|nr:DUF1080 domain-containing protein [Thalassotalea atypica]
MNRLNHYLRSSIGAIKGGAVSLFMVLQPLAFAHDNVLTEKEEKQGWQLLFNGKDMSAWRNFKQSGLSDKWQVIEGEIRLTEKGGGDILTKDKYQNFDLKLEWKISKAGNSGIFVMADELGKQIYSHAIEVQILDNQRHSDNKIDSHLSGSLYDLIASPKTSHKPAGQWNQVRILLNKNALKVWQNQVQTVDISIGSEQWNKLVTKSKFSDWQGFAGAEIGHIGLQDHSDPVAFKNIKIKAL